MYEYGIKKLDMHIIVEAKIYQIDILIHQVDIF